MKEKLVINEKRLKEINEFLTKSNQPVIDNLLNVINKYGTPEEINQKASEAMKLENKMKRLEEMNSPYLADLKWLIDQKEKNAFVSIEDYKKSVLGDKAASTSFDKDYAVTLEISALQYFPWLIDQVKQTIEKKELLPGRFIRVRMMKEQEADQGDIIAVSAAMDILGATWVETLDTKGTDGSNIHLGGPETITGYFGGVGQPNDHALKWLDEYLYYYTNYGVKQILNVNPGTVLVAYLVHKLGVDIEFKISVFMGNDNPYSVLGTLLYAKMFSREDGTTPLIGFNFSNSINNESIELSSTVRKDLDLEDFVRFEHHITETWKSIILQPYDRTEELCEVAKKVRNIAAKHEGARPDVDKNREHPSDILEYFIPKKDVEAQGLMPALLRNYLDKHDALNHTARRLTESGIPVVAAWNVHK
ncbi:MAG: hypothetical protein KAQ98_04775 [Bacteriovoracaceae bacterium]|nr:hypothetical protein [Bacteriovoracaceae bacterium]